MTNEIYNFPELKRGDSFFPALNGNPGGMRFRIYDTDTGVAYNDLDITIQFKNSRGYCAQTFATEPTTETNYIVIERELDGWYNVKTHIVTIKPDTYYHDWEFVWPIELINNSRPTLSTRTGKRVILQDITNSKL